MTTVIAVDLGGTNLRTALIDSDATILAHTTTRTPTTGPSGQVITTAIMARIEAFLRPQRKGCSHRCRVGRAAGYQARGCTLSQIAFHRRITEPLNRHFGRSP